MFELAKIMQTLSAEAIWLGIGIVLILLEFALLPAIGCLFLGLGAITTAITINYLPLSIIAQICLFGIISIVWLTILWYPCKRIMFDSNPKLDQHFNFIGVHVEVINADINGNGYGEVLCSDTVFNAQLQGDNQIALVGENIEVIGIRGNVLLCKKIS